MGLSLTVRVNLRRREGGSGFQRTVTPKICTVTAANSRGSTLTERLSFSRYVN